MKLKHYLNNTTMMQTIYDAWMTPHRVMPGEEIEIVIDDTSEKTVSGGGVVSIPPNGKFKIKNFYVDENGKVIVEWDNVPAS